MEESSTRTYEQANAQRLISSATDPIHYSAKYSYRNSPYRHLHHQNGKIGTFTVRLVEAKNLQRRHWSVLSMGPVKLLGLSQAHGEVSSFATMRLHFRSRRQHQVARGDLLSPSDGSGHGSSSYDDQSIGSSPSTASSTNASASMSSHSNMKKPASRPKMYYSKEYKSSVVQSNSNPRWPSVQSEENISSFAMDLEKGAMPHDGMEIFLRIQMREEWSAADSLVPVKGGGDGVLGEAEINLTPLVLRGFGYNVSDEEVDVYDQFVDLIAPKVGAEHNSVKDGENPSKVKLLISYEPNGMKPRRGDVVALESFARQPLSTSFRPIVSPLLPMRVKDIRGEYLLCAFDLQTQNDHRYSTNGESKAETREGSVRLHRNAVFLIERTNIVDCAVDVALKPTDVFLSTSLGKEVSQTLSPYVESAGDVLMPAVLSAKLLVEAGKVGGSAFAVGMKSAVANVVENQDPMNKRRGRRRAPSD